MVEMRPKYLPGQFSFAVSGGVRFDSPDEVSDGIQLVIRDPAGNAVSNAPPMKPTEQQAQGTGFMFGVMVVNLLLQVEGRYRVSVEADGKEIGSLDIPIRKADDDS
jgi:hypothetical protein